MNDSTEARLAWDDASKICAQHWRVCTECTRRMAVCLQGQQFAEAERSAFRVYYQQSRAHVAESTDRSEAKT